MKTFTDAQVGASGIHVMEELEVMVPTLAPGVLCLDLCFATKSAADARLDLHRIRLRPESVAEFVAAVTDAANALRRASN